MAQAIGDLGRAERAHARGGEFDGQRQAADALHDPGDGVQLRSAEVQIGTDRTGPVGELLDGRVVGQ